MSKVDQLQELLVKVTGPAKRRVLEELRAERLRDQIRGCRACPLGRQRTRAVPWSGPIGGKADLLIVGEAPGADEDRAGVPFVGRSGLLLNRLLEQAGTSREQCFVANTLCCRPPDNRDPRPYELHACQPNFAAQIDIAGLWLGVALGGFALASILGKRREEVQIGRAKENVYWKDGRVWLATYHPSYGLRNMDGQLAIAASLRWAMAIRRGDINIPKPDFSELKVRDSSERDLGTVIERKGWAMIYSRVLETKIILLKNETYANKVPASLKDLCQYTIEEWLKVGQLGPKRGGWTADELKRLHFVKCEMGGEVIAG